MLITTHKERVMKISNRHNINPIFEEVYNSISYEKGDVDISATQLIDSPKIKMLKEHNEDKLSSDLNSQIPSMLGTIIHEKLSSVPLPYPSIVEARLVLEMHGWKISGQPDLISLKDRKVILSDYKYTGEYSVRSGKIEWERQLNVYAYMIKHGVRLDTGDPLVFNDEPIEKINKLIVTAILRDWKQRAAMRDKEYPQSWVVDMPIRLWSDVEQKEKFEERIFLHKEAHDLYEETKMLPPCTDEERWMQGHTYAVMKAGKKRAEKLFSDRYEAELHCSKIKGGYVEDRIPEDTRCQNYCNVSDFCEQWFRSRR